MNKVILMGRLTRDPEVRYSQGENAMAVARYTLAVDRRFNRNNDDQSADFISCVAFGRSGEFAEKYLNQGKQILIVGRIQVRSWEDKNNQKQWSTEVIVEEHYFTGSKVNKTEENGFYTVEESDDDLPF